jgi:hypothetical protein
VEAGQRFGRGVVTGTDAGQAPGTGYRLARLACDCGAVYKAAHADLRRGYVRSCGCARRPAVRAGQRFGRGVVTDPDAGRNAHGHRLARLRCDCGTAYEAAISALRAGKSTSCGCRGRTTRLTHGLSKHPLFKTWKSMIARCENPADPAWPDYGGRGITVCPAWHDPARFIADVEAEIGPRPPGRTPGGRPCWTLDRVDNDGGYRPGNIRWATYAGQNRNRRSNGRGHPPARRPPPSRPATR